MSPVFVMLGQRTPEFSRGQNLKSIVKQYSQKYSFTKKSGKENWLSLLADILVIIKHTVSYVCKIAMSILHSCTEYANLSILQGNLLCNTRQIIHSHIIIHILTSQKTCLKVLFPTSQRKVLVGCDDFRGDNVYRQEIKLVPLYMCDLALDDTKCWAIKNCMGNSSIYTVHREYCWAPHRLLSCVN